MDSAEVIRILNDLGLNPQPYSGRFMFNRICTAVTSNTSHDVIRAIRHTDLPFPKFDTLGKGIIAYWPSIEWVDVATQSKDTDLSKCPDCGRTNMKQVEGKQALCDTCGSTEERTQVITVTITLSEGQEPYSNSVENSEKYEHLKDFFESVNYHVTAIDSEVK